MEKKKLEKPTPHPVIGPQRSVTILQVAKTCHKQEVTHEIYTGELGHSKEQKNLTLLSACDKS